MEAQRQNGWDCGLPDLFMVALWHSDYQQMKMERSLGQECENVVVPMFSTYVGTKKIAIGNGDVPESGADRSKCLDGREFGDVDDVPR